jgi:hypothetical protein
MNISSALGFTVLYASIHETGEKYIGREVPTQYAHTQDSRIGLLLSRQRYRGRSHDLETDRILARGCGQTKKHGEA